MVTGRRDMTPGADEVPEDGKKAEPRRRKPRFEEPYKSKVDIWLISFSDVTALMLTFFVLLYAMAEPETKTWSRMVASLQSQFNITLGALHNPGFEAGQNIDRIHHDPALDLQYLSALLDRLMENYEELGEARIHKRGDSLVVSLPSDLLFAPGDAKISAKGAKAVFVLGGTLGNISNRIEIYGHTDPRPVKSSNYETNWDLSLARAASVAALLKESGYRRDMIVQGWADRDFDSLDPALDQETRQNRARRVDVVIRAGRNLMEQDGESTP